jgi:hypothetical protein
MNTDPARQAFDRLYGHLNLSAEDAAWHVFKSGWEAREQPAPAQEPVAQEWRYYFRHSGATGKHDEVVGPCFTDRKEVAFGVGCFDQTALFPPTPAQAPVAIPEDVRSVAKAMQKDGYRGPLAWAKKVIDFVADYTTPPAPAQPLTDEQIADYLGDEYHIMTEEELRFFKLGEQAAHGIKAPTIQHLPSDDTEGGAL